MVTADEVPNPQEVDMWLEVNGVRRQTRNTRTQIFGVAHIVSYLSRFMAPQAGDVIATGTPPGVGLGHKPSLFLKAGDRVELGSRMPRDQRQEVAAFDDERTGRRWREGHLPLF
jgi:2,4-diketo-3-deoxy-L-fuconate hydrolase